MATFDFQSVIQYDRTGSSFNFKNSGNFSSKSGTLDDQETVPPLDSPADTVFENGVDEGAYNGADQDTFDFFITPDVAGSFPDYSSGETVTLSFVGTYTIGGFTSVILADLSTSSPEHGFVFSPEDAATTTAAMPNVINAGDSEFDGGDFVTCFAEGTGIATPNGECAVEKLSMGDCVLDAFGRDVVIKWIGRQTVSTRFGPAERLMPVRFAAGSLGDGVPHSDLTVTADHAILVDGVLCHAGALVNGTTITRVPLAEMGERYTVYHIETEGHEIILANGAPAETFIDNVSRRVFDNYSEFEALYGDVPEMQELPLPRAMSARQVPEAIRQRLLSFGLEASDPASTSEWGKLTGSR